MHTDVNASDCSLGCAHTVTESALKVNCVRKILCHTGELTLPQWHASLKLYELSYIPTLKGTEHGLFSVR